MTDLESYHIIDDLMIPHFRSEDYDTAILQAWDRVEGLARQEVFPVREGEG